MCVGVPRDVHPAAAGREAARKDTQVKVQKYTCWAPDLGRGEYQAASPEDAAEYFLEENWTGDEGDTLVNVREPNGTEYEVTVAATRNRPTFSAKA